MRIIFYDHEESISKDKIKINPPAKRGEKKVIVNVYELNKNSIIYIDISLTRFTQNLYYQFRS